MEIMRLKIRYEIMKMNEKENKLNIEMIFRIKKKMWEWFRDKNKNLNENEREIIYYLQKDWIRDLYEFLNKEMRENIYNVYYINLDKKVWIIIYREW